MEKFGGNSLRNVKGKLVPRRNKSKRAIEGRDYISSLPHSILIHIFSLLPLKDLVVTSLVSKQWEQLVMAVMSMIPSTILFDEFDMASKIIYANIMILQDYHIDFPQMHQFCLRYSIIAGSKKFTQFVNRTLNLHNGCTIKRLSFGLCYDGFNSNKEKIDKWFRFAMTNKVKKLEFDFSNGMAAGHDKMSPEYELPPIQSASRALESFSFKCGKIKMSNLGAFCYLQSLVLKLVSVVCFSIEDLVTKCPMLKSLKLESCHIPLNFLICRKDIMIESLMVISCYTPYGPICPIDLSAPELLILTLELGFLIAKIDIKAPKLIDIDIRVDEQHTDAAQRQALVKFMGNYTHCERLSLGSWCIQVLSYGVHILQQAPILFHKLTHLKLQVDFQKQELPGIAYIMECCPYMESLTIDLTNSAAIRWGDLGGHFPIAFEFEAEQFWQSQVLPSVSLQYYLKEVKVSGICGKSCEMSILQFILENAKVLEPTYVYGVKNVAAKLVQVGDGINGVYLQKNILTFECLYE
ncbi:putative F-box/LRR-repeat protein At5g02700 [Abrus precatorius]|uniref:F-box/LRR-repeat protein At5g02700 n=1 Tax=Abrus precatorius TaxID=3816 RepID=A0A8B8LIS0_ABRPR|nr:putative F-box/LRR-repeat protein At5g02700 [Abrus precatorius]